MAIVEFLLLVLFCALAISLAIYAIVAVYYVMRELEKVAPQSKKEK